MSTDNWNAEQGVGERALRRMAGSKEDIEQGRREERAAVVAYLHEHGKRLYAQGRKREYFEVSLVALSVERGEHVKTEGSK